MKDVTNKVSKDLFEDMERKYEFSDSDRVGNPGWNGTVYRISEDKIAKIPSKLISLRESVLYGGDKAVEKVMNEHTAHKLFYELFEGWGDCPAGVAESFGTYAVRMKETGIYYPAVIKRYLDGPIISDMEGEEREKAVKAFRDAVDYLESKGVYSMEFDYENAIWVPKEQKLYFFDLDGWKIYPEGVIPKFKQPSKRK